MIIRNMHRLVGYLGLVLVLALGLLMTGALRQARASEGATLLPNLVADPPDNVSLETSTTDGGLSGQGEARLLLRFNGYVHNVGPGALDFRGEREKPKVSEKTEKEVEHARETESSLPQKTEEELASPPMKVFQRLFTTNSEETNIERPHVNEPSSGEMIYVSADGHHHWHLQRVAKYSLWNAAKTAEVAPAQKVGFCLEDSEHVEPKVGPTKSVYADNIPPYRDFCQQFRPNATGLFEGISPGWRDAYKSDLSFQWVDASNVLPGEYWLREDVNPLGVIKEAGGANAPSYANSPTIIPGFDALAQATSAQAGEAKTVTLTSKTWNDSTTPKYTIVSQPQHGTLGAVNKNQVVYTPASGYSGSDSFTFAAGDPNSPFPHSPAVATVSIEVTAGSGSGSGLLVGDATSAYPVGDQTTAGREESFQFTAKSSGTVEELQFRTSATANTGITGLSLGIFAESAGHPGELLGKTTVSGEPGTNAWIKGTGLSTAVVGATKYWLVVLPLGPSSAKLHYNVAAGSGGTGNLESTAGGLSALTPEASWATFNQGPVGFQALGSSAVAQPSVTIEGAPSSMVAGTSVQLSARVTNDSPNVTWKASAGSITSGGLYTAPAEPPAGGSVVVSATSTKGAFAQRSIEITAATTTKGLLVGDATSTYPAGDQTSVGREEAFQFTAKSSGVVEEMQFRTNASSNAGITSVGLGVFAENAGKPGEELGGGVVSGEPATSSWIKVSGLAASVVSGSKYWLVVLPRGESGKKLHFNATVSSGGTGNVESVTGGLATLTAEASWETYNQGPVGFQALGTISGTGSAQQALATPGASAVKASATPSAPESTPETRPLPSVSIEGTPVSMTAGTSAQLAALVTNDGDSAVRWSASAGAITPTGLYTAPAKLPAGGAVVIRATGAEGVHDVRTVGVLPLQSPRPAPAVSLPPAHELLRPAGKARSPQVGSSSKAPPLAPQAMLVGRNLILTTRAPEAGRIRLVAYHGKRRLGACAVETPANRSFTCQLQLSGLSAHAAISVVATLRVGDTTLRSVRLAQAVPSMKMPGARISSMKMPVASHLLGRYTAASARFFCSPSLRPHGPLPSPD